jgi:hypothetical protein
LSLRIVRGHIHEHADAPYSIRLLCERDERPRRRAAEQRDEVAAANHSITSSASDSQLSEIVTPSAFAVFKLIRTYLKIAEGCRSAISVE